MARHILRCPQCNRYTMDETCVACKEITIPVRPPKYSPEDHYGKYRRKVKRPQLENEGLI